MKNSLILGIIICCSTLLVAKLSGDNLLEKAVEKLDARSSQGILIQKIETTSGQMRRLKYKSFSAKNGKNVLLKYLEPARVQGNAMLMRNHSKDIWMYNSRTRRVRKLASHASRQGFEGSDFTYEDMGGGKNWTEDYRAEKAGKEKIRGTTCFKLVCNPAAKQNPTYSKLVLWIRKSDSYPLKIDYYKKGELLKTLDMQQIEKIEGIPTARKMVMRNHQEGTRTIMKYKNITYDVNYNRNFFTERNLKN